MVSKENIVNSVVKLFSNVVCDIDDNEINKIPKEGPYIIIANHINFLDIPLLYTRLIPRPVVGFSKIENWDNPLYKFLFKFWEAIPLVRGTADMKALRTGIKALKEDKMLAIFPEGTRSHNGQLGSGHPGMVLMAMRSGAPIIPIISYGHENYKEMLRKLRRSFVKIKVGNPFYVNIDNEVEPRDIRTEITKEIMYQLAALLPHQYRGYYADIANATEKYLKFPEGSFSNLNFVTK
jgi:1-acyl-sn-glycerol-3-phosphate acyltransferase